MVRRLHGAIALLLVLVLVFVSARAAAAAQTGSQTVDIEEGKFKSFGVHGSGDFSFSVEVVEGGHVDVYVCDSPPAMGSMMYIDGYDYVDVGYVEDSVPRGDDDVMYVVVENGDNVGSVSEGDVRVRVAWEAEGAAPQPDPVASLFILVLVVVFAVVILIAVVLRVVRRPKPEYVVEDVFVDERGRRIAPPQAAAPSADRWCPRCGSERLVDPYTGRIYCPNCTPPPPPPG